ncbi:MULTISPECIES: hypothetical protein [Pseudovibrio]|uniref:hypothetical protein n=1 Tax=Stappiaceae TaxID=2821832 RepID=UPI002365D496|nr:MULTISPECIES: hypothetical protein [Pseudovibrio]MDD7909325.1 hypothetical protein [Pseudovibrio exalbescens]MDX5594885.1 hypothetical protein [Pseudovibrio sp. SPO723]
MFRGPLFAPYARAVYRFRDYHAEAPGKATALFWGVMALCFVGLFLLSGINPAFAFGLLLLAVLQLPFLYTIRKGADPAATILSPKSRPMAPKLAAMVKSVFPDL